MDIDIVHTHLYTDKAFKDLEAILVKALDFTSGNTYTQVTGFDVSRAPDGEVIFVQNDNTSYCINWIRNCVWSRGNAGFCKWFGCMIRRLVVSYFNINDWDSFSSKEFKVRLESEDECTGRCISREHSVSIASLHFYYDFLLNHKLNDSVYSKATVDDHVGKPFDPITTEIMIAKRDEIRALIDTYYQTIQKLEYDCKAKCDELEKECDDTQRALEKKLDDAKSEAFKKYNADLKAIEARYTLIPAVA